MEDAKKSRVAIVTGATGTIGRAIARQLAQDLSFEVVLVARDPVTAEQIAQSIEKATGNPKIRCAIADLSRKSSIEQLRSTFEGPLHVLINNAAIAPRRRLETPEGLEMQFATNIMGYYWMMEAFSDLLADAAPSRIVNVASYWAGDMDVTDLQFERRLYDNGIAYRQSKQANRSLTVAFAQRFKDKKISVNVCHSGDVNSKLSQDLGFGGSESPERGAATPVFLATRPAGQEISGKYFERLKQRPCRFCSDLESVKALYEVCSEFA